MAKKQKSKILNIILSVVLAIIGTFFLITAITTIYQRVSLQKQADIVNAELEKLEEEKARVK